MNWKIIFQLSIFGLIMAFGTISLIPEKVEPAFWLIIFIFCAFVIAKACPGKYFLHGFLVSMVNCVWITAVHVAFRQTYVANHPQMAEMSIEYACGARRSSQACNGYYGTNFWRNVRYNPRFIFICSFKSYKEEISVVKPNSQIKK